MTTATRPISVSYAQRSELRHGAPGPGAQTEVLLALDSGRGAVGIRGQVSDAGLLRDALLTATAVLGSDLRYRGRDRTAYLAYLAKKGKRTTAAIWEAQKAFLDESLAADEQPTAVLPPVLTVHPDEVALEVFSRDESAYARLSLSSTLFSERQVAHGTSYVDLPPALIEELDRLRGGQKVRLEAGVALPRPAAHGASPSPYVQALKVPLGALRSFLQVQTAATLPAVACELMPIDLYNLLFALRTRKAKKSPRALRFELIPGAAPRLILEPWDLVLEGHGAPFRGPSPVVVRTFGRQRLLLLARLLPHVRRARALLLGPGLPAFWVLDLGPATLTLALTGWTESGWASAAAFDALMPGAGAERRADAVEALLLARGPLTAQQILEAEKAGTSSTTGAADEVRGALKLLALRGKVLFDVAGGTYRPRQLLAEPLDIEDIRYGSTAEARAHRLLSGGAAGEVKLTKLHEIVGEGVEIHGEITDREARRSYATRYTLDTEGRVKEASCTCPHFRRSGLREGPCEHLLALRVLSARRRAEEEALRQTPEGRKLIRAETRTLLRREPPRPDAPGEHGASGGQEVVYRVSLDQRAVRLAWGPRSGPQRQQRLWFDSDREAREAYFSRLEQLAAEGFIDAGSLTA